MNYGCQQDVLKLDDFEQSVVEELCREANSLINSAVFYLKRASRQANSIQFQYEPLDKWMKEIDNKNYRCLFSQVAQQTLISVCESFKSYSELLPLFYSGKLAGKPKEPGYRKKGGLAGITYPAQHLRLNEAIETGMICLPLGRTMKQLGGVGEIYIPCPANIHPEIIRELRIFPRNHVFYVEYIYTKTIEKLNLNSFNCLGIDHGVKNWLTCVSYTGDSFIIDGKVPNFWNHTLNREVAKHNKGFWSKNSALMTEKRNRRMRDYINKAAKHVVDYCIKNDIGTVVFGWNTGNKTKSNMGKRNNQNFVQLPTSKLKNRIKTLCDEIGIQFVETEEAYTSKASFLDGDDLYKFGEKPNGHKFSGKRITQKFYKSKDGMLINADCNGAANILRKVASNLGLNLEKIARGIVIYPFRVNLNRLNIRKSSLSDRSPNEASSF